jgi:hypothetical protein
MESLTVILPDVRFTDPVWVDMLNGKVYAVDKALWSQTDGQAVLQKLPAYDSPVLIAERNAIPLAR